MTPGYHVMSAEKYHADPCAAPSLSSSIAQLLLNGSPRKAWFSHPRLNQDYREVHDGKFDLGTAAHAALLEDGLSKIVVVEADDWRTKAAQQQRDTARTAGKTALLARHVKTVGAMVEVAQAFIAQSEIVEFWKGGESEVTGIAQEGGIWLRCRFDRITTTRRFIIDYKSTTDASPEVFSRQIVRMGYHIQDAFYRRVARLLGAHAPRFAFIAQSCEPPFECSLHGCDPALQEIGDAAVQRATDLWRQCITAKSWPSYGGRIHWAIPSTWQIKDHEERLMEAAA